jgi:hypothetical protein
MACELQHDQAGRAGPAKCDALDALIAFPDAIGDLAQLLPPAVPIHPE